MTGFAALPDLLLEPLVRAALIEDLGPNGDVTSRAVIPASTRYRAKLNAREAGGVSGMQLAAIAFRLVDPSLVVTLHRPDGSTCAPDPVGRADCAEFCRTAVRYRDADGRFCGAGCRHCNPHHLHPQDHAGAADGGKGRGAARRRI